MIELINKTIKNILLLCKADANNVWNIITVYIVIFFLSLGMIFNILYPAVINNHNSNNAYIRESQLMKEVHTILSGDSNVVYFDIFPILGGDRIIVVNYEKNNNSFGDKIELTNGWEHINNKEINEYKKSEYILLHKNHENKNTILLASVNSRWCDMWLLILKTYYLK